MVFSSYVFILLFLPLLLLCYYLVVEKYKNLVLLLFSIFFYAWGAPVFIFVILLTTFLDFHLVQWMDSAVSAKTRKVYLVASLSLNLGLLFYFKYYGFFVENFNTILSHMGLPVWGWTELILPIGISFYTFESLTYMIDVYRKVHPPLKRFYDYQLYIILFPKLIAGPIVRYFQIANQINDRKANETVDNRLQGFYRFAIGLSKKVLIANVIGAYANQVFDSPSENISQLSAWLGIVAYTFQIYFDFSGYSDMAIGIAKMLGFKFPENFDSPYISKSITEFWRRWHITLGAWMRNYLYIPLGGNRVASKWRLYFNLWIVFLASGLWHGASWNFVLWGAYHGFFLVAERIFLSKLLLRSGQLVSIIYSFTIVLFGWILFRTTNADEFFDFVTTLFTSSQHTVFISAGSTFYVALTMAALTAFAAAFALGRHIQSYFSRNEFSLKMHVMCTMGSLLLIVLCLGFMANDSYNPFIYFRF